MMFPVRLFNRPGRRAVAIGGCSAVVALAVATLLCLKPTPDDLSGAAAGIRKPIYLDRRGRPLNITYENAWNIYDTARIHHIPELLQRAFILSEDKRFYAHHGVDWLARLNAAWQNLLAGGVVRGASTITEQVIRMMHPRARTFWSRWMEGFEAMLLEREFSKIEIFEFYLNQVPYRARRRGVVQAAHYYFDRDLSTLNEKELLALAVLVRSPEWLDPRRQVANLDRSIADLLGRFELEDRDREWIDRQKLDLRRAETAHDLSHFVARAYALSGYETCDRGRVHTTIDLEVQDKAQRILDNRLELMAKRRVHNGAVLVVDHTTNEIIAWVVGFAGRHDKPFNRIDAVTVRRQPGSALKPLLYAEALRKGWTAATMLDDSPMEESVGCGMHTYHNSSRDHYGKISLREALGNSLNIPAVRAIQYVTPKAYLSFLHLLGIRSLSGHPNVYGDGLALGNGEITLYELVQAYTVLARMGDYKPLSFLEGEHLRNGHERVLSEDIASLIADILSDPGAREKEFGWDSILNFPCQTAVKTGTSSDYRDALAVGFNDRYAVGVWMGNLDYSAMDKITGSSGPALVLRSIFNELNRYREVKLLYFSENLEKHRVCIETGLPATGDCEFRDEWFLTGTGPTAPEGQKVVRIRKPSNGLMLAMDPRIPDNCEYFEFALTDIQALGKVRWFINDKPISVTKKPAYNWKLSRGNFRVRAEVYLKGRDAPVTTEEVEYRVN
ncbi:MAG: transglycosylase domain-containing protein [Desulfobacterales bacterium]|nr:transglycosylase domain-containing protein [Desulfobacterales bacterium]